jgi:predicted enzyme related to lactoylglutathione lyase
MGIRTEYAPGTFSWVDLATTDVDGARAFYASVFGWVGDEAAGGSMLRLDGSLVSAIFPLSDESRAAGAPASWTSYVTVTTSTQRLRARSSSVAASHATRSTWQTLGASR